MKRKIILWIVFGGMAVLLFFAHLFRNPINDFISENITEMMSEETTASVEQTIDSKYNYAKNGLDYEFTILQFSSTGCTICKQMETELGKIRRSKSNKINIVFLNTNYPENQNFVKYYGISAIPMQVILDKKGGEFYKNYGFISADDLIEKTATLKLN